MTAAKRNLLLLACVLVFVWLVAGAFLQAAQAPETLKASAAASAAASSMGANGADFNLVEAARVPYLSQMGQEPFRLQLNRSGIHTASVSVALLAAVLLCLKLFQTVNSPFNMVRISDYLHDQDGMK